MLYIPTRQEIALDCFGKRAKIVGEVVKMEGNGKLFAFYYTQFGDNATCSMNMKEDELVRHVGTSAKFTSHQLDDIETDMLAKGERVREL